MKNLWYLIIVTLILGLIFAGCSNISKITVPENSEPLAKGEPWDGSIVWNQIQGVDSQNCGKLGDTEFRTPGGWIHWILTQSSSVTDAKIELGGSGSESYERYQLSGGASHFFTPYYDVDTLSAIVYYDGTLGPNANLVISDYCPGDFFIEETVVVVKSANTSYTRTHLWDIDKKVETENEYFEDDLPKIWLYINGSLDEEATWTVDVTYKGFEDSNWQVSGNITILNNTLSAITINYADIVDELWIDGETESRSITIDCSPASFPVVLQPGESLTCTYTESLEAALEGYNEVTVTVGDKDYGDVAELVWGDPSEVVNECITVTDTNPEFVAEYGDVELCAEDYEVDDVETFTYSREFTWADYGKDNCGHHEKDNTATIVETGQTAEATLLVNVQCYIYETAYAKADSGSECFIPTFNNWGWTNYVPTAETGPWDLYAGAGQCDTSKGTLVGTVELDGCDVLYNVDSPYTLEETHFYIGCTPFPTVKQGKKTVQTVAPGSYYTDCTCSGDKYVIAHAVVGIPDPNFGPQE